MPTVAELKNQIAAIESTLPALKATAASAQTKLDQAQASLTANLAAVPRVSLSQLIAAQKASATDSTNAALKQSYQTMQGQWDSQQAIYLPLLAARDAASTALISARVPLVDAETSIGDLQVQIVQTDPAQSGAYPEATAYLAEQNHTVPAASNPSPTPAISSPVVTSPTPPAEVAPASNPEQVKFLAANEMPEPQVQPNSEMGFAIGAGEETISQQVAVAEQTTELAAQNPVIEAQQPAGYETGFAIGPGAETINEQVAVAEQTSALAAQNVDPAAQAAALNEQVAALSLQNPIGLTTAKAETAGAATKQDTMISPGDWRVRLSLAPSANYLYKSINPPGILLPLVKTDGVIFPYTPNIQVAYAAHYDPTELTHSNYKIFQYKGSSVDNITITCDFTAQDTAEANYLLAVIHFFRSVTKMFYGKDENPMRGIPPPLCYLTGLGQFQFDQHPLAITSFNYTLPTDVDYVRASSGTKVPGGNTGTGGDGGYSDAQSRRMAAAAVQPGGKSAPPNFNFNAATNTQATYVPTKMQISITAVPIVSRKDISDTFSLEKYATGSLLQGSVRGGGGIW